MRPERRPDWLTELPDPPATRSTSPKRKMSTHQPHLKNASPWVKERHAPTCRGNCEALIGTVCDHETEPEPEPLPPVRPIRTERWLMLDRLMGCED